jgi:hypothetical protein
LAHEGAAPVSVAAATSDAIQTRSLRFIIIASLSTQRLGCAARERNGYADVVKSYKTLAAKSKRLDRQ